MKSLLSLIISIALVLLPSSVEAKLSDKQLDQIINKIYEICPTDLDNIDKLKQAITDNFNKDSIFNIKTLRPLHPYTLGGCGDGSHELLIYSERVYLDGVDISTPSQDGKD